MNRTLEALIAAHPSRAQLRTIDALRRAHQQLQYPRWWHLPTSHIRTRVAALQRRLAQFERIDTDIVSGARLPSSLRAHAISTRGQYGGGFNRAMPAGGCIATARIA